MDKKTIFVISKVNKTNDGELYMSAWNEYNLEDAEKSVKQDFRNDMEEKFNPDDYDDPDGEWDMDDLHQCSSTEYYCEIDGEETHYLITKMNV